MSLMVQSIVHVYNHNRRSRYPKIAEKRKQHSHQLLDELCQHRSIIHYHWKKLIHHSRHNNIYLILLVVMGCIVRISASTALVPSFVMQRSHHNIMHLLASGMTSRPNRVQYCFVASLQNSRYASIHTKPSHYTSLCTKASINEEQQRINNANIQSVIQNLPQRSRKQSNKSQSRQHSTRPKNNPRLEKPEVIYSNNHLLVVNKPAGWKSQPGNGGGGTTPSSIDPKCLLTYLKSQQLGGGSNKDFLIPTHRLDQPCTGVLILAKNGKAASRVQVAWSKQQVKKCYWVVVEGGSSSNKQKMNGLELLKNKSVPINGTAGTHRLSAILKSTKGNNARGGRRERSNNNAGGSVICKPLPPNYLPTSNDSGNNSDGRVCHIEWKHLRTIPPSSLSPSNARHLLSVKTDTGAKHQVRALLALAGGTPICGDLRYGNSNNNNGQGGGRVDEPLPDASVALHARDVYLKTISLGNMDFLKDKPFVASIPIRWREFFGLREDDVKRL